MAASNVKVGSLWAEFKEFAFKGNMIDLAVGVVIGLAFKDVVDAIVANLIMPIVSWVQPKPTLDANGKAIAVYQNWEIFRIKYGLVMSAFINFLIVAAAVFMLVKLIKLATVKSGRAAAATAAPSTRECPRCLSTIPIRATRCAHCTADLPPTLPEQTPVIALPTDVAATVR